MHRRVSNRTSWAAVGLAALLAAGSAQADHVRAKGRVLFKDSDGVKKPFAHVQVRLMDSDSDYDEEMARGYTDDDGTYDLSGNAGDSPCIGCGSPDPYVKVVLEQPGRIEVHDIMHYTRNAVLTPTREETSGTIDFGTRTFTSAYPEGMAAILYVRAQQAYQRFSELSGDAQVPGNGGEVAVEIPVVLSFGTPYTTWDTIHWPGVATNYDAFDHEFGHRLRHAADGGVTHFNDDLTLYRYARDHELDEDSNLGFAFNEGWAHYFRHQLQPGYLSGTWNGVNKGDEVEGHVASKLVGLGAVCGGFKEMWAALKANPGQLHSYQEFSEAFLARKPPCPVHIKVPIQTLPSPKASLRPMAVSPALVAKNVAAGRSAIKRTADAIDLRATGLRPRAQARIPAAIGPQHHAVVNRLWTARVRSAQTSEAAARAAYRRLVSALPPASPASLADGSYERAAREARAAFVTAVAEPRLRDVQGLRGQIAAEKAKATDAALLGYLKRVDERYAQLETQLKTALDSRGGESVAVPLGILPRSFAGPAQAAP